MALHARRLLQSGLLIVVLAAVSTAQALFPVHDSTGEAPNRTFDVLHYRLDVTFDEANKSVSGHTTITFVPFLPALRTVTVDAESMKVSAVTLSGKPLQYTVGPSSITVSLDKAYSPHDTLAVDIAYSCTPRKGLYFIQPDSANPSKPCQIWSQGEDMDNHNWFPCYDFPNDKATSEVIATVRDEYTVLSNGRLVSVTSNKKDKTKTFHWKENLPHSSYLIMLAAGKYSVLRDTAGTVPLEYYVYPGQESNAKASFAETPAIMNFFNSRIAVKYPWEKYAQVAIADFMFGGMENTTATTLMDEAVLLDPRARIDESAVSLIAHEMAHMWWGDLVTCKDWRHLWLNEGFASYFDPLYFEATRGRGEFELQMSACQESAIRTDAMLGRKPIVSVGSLTANVYSRASSVLNMLRFVLGDELFWKAINHYITKYQYRAAETNDLKECIEEATGQNLYWFFDEWLYKAGHPVFDVSCTWNDTTHSEAVHVKQVQQTDSLTGIFRMPVSIELTTPAGATTHRVLLWTADTTFTLPSAERPTMVIFDRGNWLLKELHFSKTIDAWSYQASHAGSPIDRIRAIAALMEEGDSVAVVPILAPIALNDTSHAVRREAVSALTEHRYADSTTLAMVESVMLAAARDPNSSVRSEGVAGLRRLRGERVIAAVRNAFNDSSYAVMGSALEAIARVDSAHAVATLLPYLSVPSRRNTIQVSAMHGLMRVDSLQAIEAAWTLARPGHHMMARMSALQLLRRYTSVRPQLVEYLKTASSASNGFLGIMAIHMLGEVGNAAVIPFLESLEGSPKKEIADAAKQSVAQLRGEKTSHHGPGMPPE